MKSTVRLGYHLVFWLAYFSVNLFNELYLSSSFTAHPSSELLLDSLLAQLLVLALKIPAVYFVLYALIPSWIRVQQKVKPALETLVFLIVTLLMYRALVQLVIWPYVYHNQSVTFTLPQLTARFFYSLLDLLQVIGIAAAIKLFRLRLEAMKKEKALIKEKLQSEMLHLKSQLNPHFLFNALNSIYVLTRSQSAAAPDAVMRLSKLLRYLLYETARRITPIGEELAMLDNYLELQQIRFGDRKVVELLRRIDDPATPVAPLLLLPLLENAFKHGDTSEAINCLIVLQQNSLAVSVENVINTSAIEEENGAGIGLANNQRQLELL